MNARKVPEQIGHAMKHKRLQVGAALLAALAVMVLGLVGGALAQDSDDPPQGDDGDADVDYTWSGDVNAPDFPEGAEWINASGPIRMADLRGKIVMLDFWTYGCINCIHIIPDLKRLEAEYPEELIVIGVHSAKFDNEGETDNIRRIVQRYEVEHPVINDSDFTVWNAYGVRAWPTVMVIDPFGKVVGQLSGEPLYSRIAPVIETMAREYRAAGAINPDPLPQWQPEQAEAATPLRFPGKVLADPAGNRLFISDSNHNRIIVAALDTFNVMEIIGSGEASLQDGDFATAQFYRPQGLALTGDVLYVADTENHAIRAVNLADRSVETVAGTGAQGFNYDQSGPGREVALNSPWDVVAHENKIYIAMAGQHQLWVYDAEQGVVSPYAGTGREALQDGALRQAALNQPSGLDTDGTLLYIADSEASAIRTASLDPDGELSTIVGTGLFDFGDVDGAGEDVRLQHPLVGGVIIFARNFESRAQLKQLCKEIRRLRQMSSNNPESGYIRSWLDLVFELPWGITQTTTVDIAKAKKILDRHHYGLDDVKNRVLEYLAVLEHKQKVQPTKTAKLPTILCFVGPPGVGKTSIGQSIAEALGRSFTKISLGGVHDEAEIRGHRRTYVGAMQGRILKGILQAKSSNPVFILDEVDKLGNDFRGDPSSALLEVLDPEQNFAFEDHYLDMPFDLSEVIFITTANSLNTIPSALRDRLEIIEYSGYTQEEKFHIAKQHLLKKVLTANSLKPEQLSLSDEIITTIIERYTREAGVRTLERSLGSVIRKAVREMVESRKSKLIITRKRLKEYLGPEEYDPTLTEKKHQVGLATGLAWTSVGGDVLFIEVALTPGKGDIKLTGQLGDVMKESAQAALTYVKSNAQKLGIEYKKLQENDIHVHIPEGAVPKDGPSAGITLTTAIVSALTGKPIKKDVAMTGEVTLRGRVLRIGGLKEKAIAAHRAGSSIVIIPKDNARDLNKLPDSVKKAVQFIPVETMNQVLKLAIVSDT